MNRTHEQPIPDGVRCGDAPVYLLGLLDDRQAHDFLEHARCCAVCHDELEVLAPAVDLLPVAVPQVPAPRHMKRRVMRAVRAETAAEVTEVRARGAQRWAISGWISARPAQVFAGAVLLVLGVLLGALISSSPPAGKISHVVAADVTLAGASAALHQGEGHTWLTVSGMPRPAAGQVYEVWVKRPSDRTPRPTGGLFTPTAAGGGMVEVSGHLRAGSEVLVTAEPAGGTLEPSGPPVIVAHVS